MNKFEDSPVQSYSIVVGDGEICQVNIGGGLLENTFVSSGRDGFWEMSRLDFELIFER